MIILVIVIVLVLVFGLTAFVGAPYVPSLRRDLRRAFSELYPLGKNDVLLDVGSGDGRVLRLAANLGARAVGYEINPLLVFISIILGGSSKITTKLANIWRTPFPDDVTVVYIFMVSRDAKKMLAKLRAESIRLGRPLHALTYGDGLPGLKPVRKLSGCSLYTI